MSWGVLGCPRVSWGIKTDRHSTGHLDDSDVCRYFELQFLSITRMDFSQPSSISCSNIGFSECFIAYLLSPRYDGEIWNIKAAHFCSVTI